VTARLAQSSCTRGNTPRIVVGSLRCDLPRARIDVRYCGAMFSRDQPCPLLSDDHQSPSSAPPGAVQADGEGADHVASGVSTVTTCRKVCTASTGARSRAANGVLRRRAELTAKTKDQDREKRRPTAGRARRTISAATATRCPEHQAATGRAGPAWSLPSCRQPDRQPAPTADRVDPGWCRSDRDRHSCDHHRHRAPAGYCAGRRDLVALLIRVRSNQ
jgi:hypothetical protein